MKIKITLFVLILGTISSSIAQESSINETKAMRNVKISGLVLDSESLLPIQKSAIYDEDHKELAKTDKEGYFKIEIPIIADGEISFSFEVNKENYQSFIQKEHWGDLTGNSNAIFYIGLKKENTGSITFSHLITDSQSLSVEVVKENFKTVKRKVEFNKKVELAKKNNNDIFMQIDNSYYLVNDTGWIKLHSSNDLISLDGNINVPASELNTYVKRSQVTGMTPIESEESKFAVYTKS